MPLVKDQDRRSTYMSFQNGQGEVVRENGTTHVAPARVSAALQEEEQVDGVPETIFCQLMLNVIRALENAGIAPTVENVSAMMKPLVAAVKTQRVAVRDALANAS